MGDPGRPGDSDDRVSAGLGDDRILFGRTAGDTDRADDLIASLDRHAAAEHDQAVAVGKLRSNPGSGSPESAGTHWDVGRPLPITTE